MTATLNYGYAGQTEAEIVLSEVGLRHLLDDRREGAPDSAVIAACSELATSDIDMACGLRYSSAQLRTSVWVKWTAAWLFAYYVAIRKNGAMTAEMREEITRRRLMLGQIQSGYQAIPQLPERADFLPAIINTTIDPRYQDQKVRFQPQTSSEHVQPTDVSPPCDPSYNRVPR